MKKGRTILVSCLAAIMVVFALSFGIVLAEDNKPDVNTTTLDKVLKARGQITPSERKAAAAHNAAVGLKVPSAKNLTPAEASQGDETNKETNKQQ